MSRSWLVKIGCDWNSPSSPISWRRACGSSPLVGSSITRMSGAIASTPAIATRFFSPPDSRYGGLARTCQAPTRSQRLVHPPFDVGFGQPLVARAERDVVVDRRHEELIVGVLEDQADRAADRGSVSCVSGVSPMRTSPLVGPDGR